MSAKGTEAKVSLTEMQIRDLQRAFEKGSFSDLSDRLREAHSALENLRLDVAITGEPAVGKSTFINAFRDVSADDDDAAPTGGSAATTTTATTPEPRPYTHPKYADVRLWDLPSIGGPGFQPRDYLQQVFLVSSLAFGRYDLPLLGETLWRDLGLPRSHSFLLAAPNLSHRLLEKKRDVVGQQLWLVAVVACGQDPEPLPELSIATDVGLLLQTLRGYCVHFGLEESALRKAAAQAGLPFGQLRAVVKGPLAAEVSREDVVERLAEAASKAPKLPKPLLPVASQGRSFAAAYNMLKTFVDGATADAHHVLLRVFVSQKPQDDEALQKHPEEESGA